MVIWGIISTSTVACQSFRGLVVIRFMLGFVEAAYFVSLHTYYPMLEGKGVRFASQQLRNLDVFTISLAGIPERS